MLFSTIIILPCVLCSVTHYDNLTIMYTGVEEDLPNLPLQGYSVRNLFEQL